MHLIQLLLPLYDNEGKTFPSAMFREIRTRLTERFGGLTAYTRAPAEGLWKEGGGEPKRDEVVVYEVMVDDLDRAWWAAFRAELEIRFAQQELVVRAQRFERL